MELALLDVMWLDFFDAVCLGFRTLDFDGRDLSDTKYIDLIFLLPDSNDTLVYSTVESTPRTTQLNILPNLNTEFSPGSLNGLCLTTDKDDS